jgi:hypothetical protein
MRSRTFITTAIAAAALAAPATSDAATPTWTEAASVAGWVAIEYSGELGADDNWMEGCTRRPRRGGARRCFIHVTGESFDCHWRVYVKRHRDGSFDWWTTRAYTYEDDCDDSMLFELPTEGTLDELP